MNGELWAEVDRYLLDVIVKPGAPLRAARDASAAAGLPSIEVSGGQGKLLMVLALARGAQRILEIGTLGGFERDLAGERAAGRRLPDYDRGEPGPRGRGAGELRPCGRN